MRLRSSAALAMVLTSAAASIQALAWELPCAMGVAKKKEKKKKKGCVLALIYLGLSYLTLVQLLDSVGSTKFGKFSPIPQNIFFFSLTFFLSIWDSDYMTVRLFAMVPQVSEALFIFSSLFSCSN